MLIFDKGERTVPENFAYHLEAIAQLDPEKQAAIRGSWKVASSASKPDASQPRS